MKTSTIALLLLLIRSASASYVQGNFAAPDSSKISVTVTFNAAQVAGDLNVVVVGWDNSASVSSVTDHSGNTYLRAVGSTTNNGLVQSIYYAKNIAAAAAGANVVTVTFSSTATYPDIRILEYSGLDPSSPLDGVIAGTGSGTTTNSGSLTTTNANDLLVAANIVSNMTTAAGTGFTSRLLSSDGNIAEDRNVTAIGTYDATATQNGSNRWVMQMVAFKASSGPPPPPPTQTGLTIAPTSVTLTSAGATQQLAVRATFSDNSAQDVTSTASYMDSNSGSATVSSSGLVTAVAIGSANITASYSGFSAVAAITVNINQASPPDAAFAPNIPASPTLGGCALSNVGDFGCYGKDGLWHALLTIPGTPTTFAAPVLGLLVPVPATSSSACTQYSWAFDNNYYYFCFSTNSWRRVAWATW